jgi:hypothetical protein
MSAVVYLMIRTFSTDSDSSHEIFSPSYRLCPDQPNIAIQAHKDIGLFLEFTLNFLGIVSGLQVPGVLLNISPQPYEPLLSCLSSCQFKYRADGRHCIQLCQGYEYIALTFLPQPVYGDIVKLEISQDPLPILTRILMLVQRVLPGDLGDWDVVFKRRVGINWRDVVQPPSRQCDKERLRVCECSVLELVQTFAPHALVDISSSLVNVSMLLIDRNFCYCYRLKSLQKHEKIND